MQNEIELILQADEAALTKVQVAKSEAESLLAEAQERASSILMEEEKKQSSALLLEEESISSEAEAKAASILKEADLYIERIRERREAVSAQLMNRLLEKVTSV